MNVTENIGGTEVLAIDTLTLAGAAYLGLGRNDDARRALTRALALAEKRDDPGNVIDVLTAFAELHVRTGEYAEALRECHRAVKLIPHTVRGLSDLDSASARSHYACLFERGARAAIETGSSSELCFFLEGGRARALLKLLGGPGPLQSSSIPEALRQKEASARAAEAAAFKRYERALRIGNLKEVRARKAALRKARAGTKAVIETIQRKAKSVADFLYPEAASLKTIRSGLREAEALVLYLLGTNAAALVITRKAARSVRLGEGAEVEDLFADCNSRGAVGPLARDEGASATECVLLGSGDGPAHRPGDAGRAGPKHAPANKPSAMERATVLANANGPLYRDVSPHPNRSPACQRRGVRRLGVHVLPDPLGRDAAQAPRAVEASTERCKPKKYVPTGPNQVWSWDVTYLRGPVASLAAPSTALAAWSTAASRS